MRQRGAARIRPVTIRWIGWGIAALLLPASAAAQEDKIISKTGHPDRTGKIITVSCKTVYIKLANIARGAAQPVERDDVAELKFDPGRDYKYSGATSAMDRGNYSRAIADFKKIIQAGKPSQWVVQFSYYRMAECHRAQEKWAEWERTLKELKTKAPETYFLYDIYSELTEYYTRNKKFSEAGAMVQEMQKHGTDHGHNGWKSSAKYLSAVVLRGQGNKAGALSTVQTILSDPLIGMEAKILELRLLVESGRANSARSKASRIVKKKAPKRLMTAAYNALGDAERLAGKHKDAMLHYLRGTVDLGAFPSAEHEYAMAYAAISMATYGKASSDATIKGRYVGRAHDLWGKLVARYGKSELSAQVEAALK